MSFLINSKTYFGIMLILIAFAECFAIERIENDKIPKIWNVNNVSEYFVGREKQIKASKDIEKTVMVISRRRNLQKRKIHLRF